MPRRWTHKEERFYRKELQKLYLLENKSIKEVARVLNISEKTVFQRLKRLRVPTQPHKKEHYRNKRTDILVPKNYTDPLAEFFGIMLGDGHISHFQVTVTLGNKEVSYAGHVKDLIHTIFSGNPKISIKKDGYRTVYLGSTEIVSYLKQQGLVANKVQNQVDIPKWIFTKDTFMRHFLKGFFDTDGSVYAIRHGIQIGLSNRSTPLLQSLQQLLLCLKYSPSRISCNKIYITKQSDICRFFEEIQPQNSKHKERYKRFSKRVGTQAVNEDRL